MAAPKGRQKPAGSGRQKGTLNVMTRTAKEAIELAAEGIGGTNRLIEWIKEDEQNEKVFWSTMYTKLLPLQVTGDANSPLVVQLVRFGDNNDSE